MYGEKKWVCGRCVAGEETVFGLCVGECSECSGGDRTGGLWEMCRGDWEEIGRKCQTHATVWTCRRGRWDMEVYVVLRLEDACMGVNLHGPKKGQNRAYASLGGMCAEKLKGVRKCMFW